MPARVGLEKIEKPPSVDDTAYLHIKRAILDCALAPGQGLVETRLAEELGVSRTPVRRAIARLEQEGFAVTDGPKGYKVAEISREDLGEIYKLREILECHMVRETASSFTDEELDEIEVALRAADQALGEDDYGAFLAANRAFHHSFDRKYGNQRVSDLLVSLDEHTWRNLVWVLRAKGSARLTPSSYHEHRLVLEALREGDVETAVSLVRDHLRKEYWIGR